MLRLSRAQLREVDRIAIEEYGLPGIVLMENAAIRAASIIDRNYSDKLDRNVLIVCGAGNNAGDGYALARHLAINEWGITLLPLVPQEKLTGDAAIMAHAARRMNLPIIRDVREAFAAGPTLVIDAITGTGLKRPLEGDMALAVRLMNVRHNAPRDYRLPIVVALDVPSGLDCDTGDVIGDTCVQANFTVTFAAYKLAYSMPKAYPYTGIIHLAGIGIPDEIIERAIGT